MEMWSRHFILMMIAKRQIRFDKRRLKKDEKRELKILEYLEQLPSISGNHAVDVVGRIAGIK